MSGAAAFAKDESALTNEAIVTLVRAGLSSDLVIAKIEQAENVDFKLDVDNLILLKQQKVPEPVIKAMLDKTASPATATASTPPPAAAPAGDAFQSQLAYQSEVLGMGTIRVSLVESTGNVPLRIVRGEFTTTGMGFMAFMDFPGLAARIRTSERRPVLLVQSATPLTGGRYFLAKLDVDEDDGVRSLKISSAKGRFKAMFGSARKFAEPDHDWVVGWTAEEAGPDLWRVTPERDLEPGEYGWYIDMGAGLQQTGLYDFGVDS